MLRRLKKQQPKPERASQPALPDPDTLDLDELDEEGGAVGAYDSYWDQPEEAEPVDDAPENGTGAQVSEPENDAVEPEATAHAEQAIEPAPVAAEQPEPEQAPAPRTLPRPETDSRYRREDERRREEARTATLQSQVDELRQLLRELTSRQQRQEEGTKHQQSLAAQNQIAIEQVRKDMEQNAQARALDENRTRQKIDDLESRIDDGIRPIRSLQAHVTEILEESRKKVDDTAQTVQRFDELGTMIEHLSAMSDRTSTLSHGLRDNIDALRGEMDGLRRDIIRSEDAIKIVDQEARRRSTEVQDVAEGYNSRIDELRSDLAHLYEMLENTRRGLVHVDPTLDELRTAEEGLRQEFTRHQTLAEERHDMLIDMHDDARQESDARFEQLRQNMEERFDRLNERIEEITEMHREFSYRIGSLNSELEELRQVDTALHRDIWYLHEQRVRIRMEQIQEELDAATTQRRDAESETRTGAGRRPRRRSDVESDI
jgi:chromosome segregation ATPase